MKAVFVGGTDTGVGKTLVAGLLANHLQKAGLRVVTQKWVQTGKAGGADDVRAHLRLMGRESGAFRSWARDQVPYSFQFPASPLLASRLEGRGVSPAVIRGAFRRLAKNFDVVVVEGVGGLLVPCAPGCLQTRLVRELGLPVLLVAGNRLGAINQTLLSLEALASRRIRSLGVVFNCIDSRLHPAIARDNPRMVESFSGKKVLGVLPWTRNRGTLARRFAPVGNAVMAGLGLAR